MFCRKNLRKQTLFLKSGAKVQKILHICKYSRVFLQFFLYYSSFWVCLFLMIMRQKVYIHSIYSKSSKNAKMAEKWSGMHFVLAYVKKKLYLCTRLCLYMGRKDKLSREK